MNNILIVDFQYFNAVRRSAVCIYRTYEEYLQVLGRRNGRPIRSVAGPSWSVHEPPKSREKSSEDWYSHHQGDLYTYNCMQLVMNEPVQGFGTLSLSLRY
ncbi:hypothetical protein MKX01_042001 [Papaver californicum]|nr:hypothetical protein MKX01_042001 [Papaver californicum]